MNKVTLDIKHEHLAGIAQHDWYRGCGELTNATLLEDMTYRVFVLEQEQNDVISFTCRRELMIWAGY